MINLLAIDTATEVCSVVLQYQGERHRQHVHAPRQHNQIILGMIEQVLSEAGVALTQLDGIAFGNGPGSFVGVRIAAGVVQGLAFGADLPVLPISSLQILAQGAARQYDINKAWVLVDARANQIYSQGFSRQAGIMLPDNTVTAIAPEAVKVNDEYVAIGNGWLAYQDRIKTDCDTHLIHSDFYADAQDILLLAQYAWEQGSVITADQIKPEYVMSSNWTKVL